jgi:hypothetical protein
MSAVGEGVAARRRRLIRQAHALVSEFAERRPRWHRIVAVALALFAGMYLLAFPVMVLVFGSAAARAAGNSQWIQLTQYAFVTGACVLATGWIWRIRPTTPSRHRLDRAIAPRLFQLIDSVCNQLTAPRPTAVLLDEGTDVRLLRIPRSAYPFACSRVLVIGLPVLQLSSPLHMKALFARCLGQSARQLRRLDGWLWIMRSHGAVMLSACPGWRRPAHVLVRAFFAWYAPLFRFWTAPIARREELRGDRYMMDLINDRDAAELICLQHVLRRYLHDRYFPSMAALSRRQPGRPLKVYSDLDRRFNRYWSQADAEYWLQQAWLEEAVNAPGHMLRRRLTEIGHLRPQVPPPLRTAASRALLGRSLAPTLSEFNRSWMRGMARRLDQAKGAEKKGLHRLRYLQRKSRRSVLGVTEALELASLVHNHQGKSKARRYYEQLLLRYPHDARVNFNAGRFLHAFGDPRGRAALKKLATLDQTRQPALRPLPGQGSDVGDAEPRVTHATPPAPRTTTVSAVRGEPIETIEFEPVEGFDHQFSTGEYPVFEDHASESSAGSASGMRAAVSDSGLHGTAAIEAALHHSVGVTGQPVLTTELDDVETVKEV